MIRTNMWVKVMGKVKLVMSLLVMDRPGQKGPGKGKGAGDQPGEDYFEAEVSLVELEEALFKQLELPNLKRKEQQEDIVEDIEFNDIRKTGLNG